MARIKSRYVCQNCGYESPKWMGNCPCCNEWNTLVEEKAAKEEPGRRSWVSAEPPKPITDIEIVGDSSYTTGISEFDRVLGGGVVVGSLVLIGGEPGIGKSTLVLQAAGTVAESVGKVLYVSGEESANQIMMRAKRLGILNDGLFVLTETNIERIIEIINDMKPALVVIDSIQTMYTESIASAPGSVGQVRESTAFLMRAAKNAGIPMFIIGHVTKSGAIAGPRVLEHMVDTVLYFEGERHHTYRILRSVKNRYGSTNELGIFEMGEKGLREVLDPSATFISERPAAVPGSVITASIEGSRPLLVEVQALVGYTPYPTPKRTVTGVDYNRVSIILAVLEKRAGLYIGSNDVYLSVAGGVRIDEPAVDLACAMAVASSFRNKAIDPATAVFGEVGLSGEVRAVGQSARRINEALKLGFKRCILPARNLEKSMNGNNEGIELIGVNSVTEAIEIGLGGGLDAR